MRKHERPRPEGTEGVAVDGLRKDHPTTPRLALRADEVAASLGISRRSLQRELSAGRFPRPDLHVGRMPLWKPATVTLWLDSLAQQGGRRS